MVLGRKIMNYVASCVEIRSIDSSQWKKNNISLLNHYALINRGQKDVPNSVFIVFIIQFRRNTVHHKTHKHQIRY